MSDETPTPADAAQPFGAGDARGASADGVTRYSQAQLRRTRDVLARLYAVRRAARYYPVDHPAVVDSVRQFADAVDGFHAEGVDVHLVFLEGEVLLGEQLLTEESILYDQLIRDLISIGLGSVVITRGVTTAELACAAQVFTADAQTIDAADGIDDVSRALGLEHIKFGAVRALDRERFEGTGTEEGARMSYSGAVSLVREIDRLLRTDRPVPPAKVKHAARGLVDNVLSNRPAMLQLTGLKNYDEYTYYHSANVAILSLALGSMITQDYRFLSSLGIGALLHDIGKLSVDVSIINKPGTLTPEEWSEMREHPVRGAQIVSRLAGIDKSAIVVIFEHHMRMDGSGYPERVPIRPQHLASRIVAVADSYDAMTSRRSYSAARVQDEAMALLVKSAGTSLDPVLVRLFVRLVGVYPARSLVRLSSGQIGIVLTPSFDDPLRPVVRVIASRTGESIEPLDVDLLQEPDLSISGCIDPRLVNVDVDTFM